MTTKENRGGARPGAGRKATRSLSYVQVNKMLTTAEAYREKFGKTIDEILLDILYSNESDIKERLQAIKLFKDFAMAKTGDEEQETVSQGPQFYLPERRPDPAKVVQLKPGNE